MNAQTIEATSTGLEGVVAAATRLSMVDGERGELVIAGKRLEQLADLPFEDVIDLLWKTAGAREVPRVAARPIPRATIELLRDAAVRRLDSMDALRMAAGTLTADTDIAAALVLAGSFPTIVAAYKRLLDGHEPVAPRGDLGLAANYLYMRSGREPHTEMVRALDTYLATVSDHGLNASTFTARVIVSTGSDFISAITGAVGALKGPLHGGAPGPALDMVFEIGDASRAAAVLRAKLDRGERLMGFGHRIYKVRDPRAEALSAAASRMFSHTGDSGLHDLARAVETTALRLLEERKPGRRLQTNVEFYTALLLHGIGLDTASFTPTFAMGRVAGWIAHCFEQRAVGRLIRPQSVYVGRLPS